MEAKSMAKKDRHYCVMQRKQLVVAHFVKYYDDYLNCQKFTIHTDHSALR